MAPTARASCLSTHVLLVSLNPSSERTSHLGRNEGPKQEAGEAWLRPPTATGCSPQLSLSRPRCNLAAVSGTSRNRQPSALRPANSLPGSSAGGAELGARVASRGTSFKGTVAERGHSSLRAVFAGTKNPRISKEVTAGGTMQGSGNRKICRADEWSLLLTPLHSQTQIGRRWRQKG